MLNLVISCVLFFFGLVEIINNQFKLTFIVKETIESWSSFIIFAAYGLEFLFKKNFRFNYLLYCLLYVELSDQIRIILDNTSSCSVLRALVRVCMLHSKYAH